MAHIQEKIREGKYTLTQPEKCRSDVYQSFNLVVDEENQPLEYFQCVQCETCVRAITTGGATTVLKRHIDKCNRAAEEQHVERYVTISVNSFGALLKASDEIRDIFRQISDEEIAAMIPNRLNPDDM